MHFETFYQYFHFSKNCAYIAIIFTLPLFVLFWNTVLYPNKDPEVKGLFRRLCFFCPACRARARLDKAVSEKHPQLPKAFMARVQKDPAEGAPAHLPKAFVKRLKKG